MPSISLAHHSCYYLKALVRFHVRDSLIEGNARGSEGTRTGITRTIEEEEEKRRREC
jgi:hypothetical protein